jgi:hypothetical protein
VRGVPDVGIVRKVRTGQLEGPIRQSGAVDDPRIGPGRAGGTGGSGREQEQVARFQGRLDYRQQVPERGEGR